MIYSSLLAIVALWARSLTAQLSGNNAIDLVSPLGNFAPMNIHREFDFEEGTISGNVEIIVNNLDRYINATDWHARPSLDLDWLSSALPPADGNTPIAGPASFEVGYAPVVRSIRQLLARSRANWLIDTQAWVALVVPTRTGFLIAAYSVVPGVRAPRYDAFEPRYPPGSAIQVPLGRVAASAAVGMYGNFHQFSTTIRRDHISRNLRSSNLLWHVLIHVTLEEAGGYFRAGEVYNLLRAARADRERCRRLISGMIPNPTTTATATPFPFHDETRFKRSVPSSFNRGGWVRTTFGEVECSRKSICYKEWDSVFRSGPCAHDDVAAQLFPYSGCDGTACQAITGCLPKSVVHRWWEC
ncbi:hypothetical protein RJ55_02859 [Drechmeria coniospora]|nr:hypothetical protein RJ55_02859 [Drechmeria coniospora]